MVSDWMVTGLDRFGFIGFWNAIQEPTDPIRMLKFWMSHKRKMIVHLQNCNLPIAHKLLLHFSQKRVWF